MLYINKSLLKMKVVSVNQTRKTQFRVRSYLGIKINMKFLLEENQVFICLQYRQVIQYYTAKE